MSNTFRSCCESISIGLSGWQSRSIQDKIHFQARDRLVITNINHVIWEN